MIDEHCSVMFCPLNEMGAQINGVGADPNMHDMLTGSQPDGRAYTDSVNHPRNNWTTGGAGTAQLGHSGRIGGGNASWNSSHPTRGCSQDKLESTGGTGLFYCFAINCDPAIWLPRFVRLLDFPQR